MTSEKTWYVRMPSDIKLRIAELDAQAKECRTRAAMLDPGDRTEALRFEAINAVIDQLSTAALANGAPGFLQVEEIDNEMEVIVSSKQALSLPTEVLRWLQEGALVTRLRIPHESGPTPQGGAIGRGPSPPAKRWQVKTNDTSAAVRERFIDLLTDDIEGSRVGQALIRPSNITNSILTESLRTAATSHTNYPPVEVPVEYLDGSEGPKFPIRCLPLSDASPPSDWPIYRFTLMSIRHVEMDTDVDGAWFRNSKLSRPRPHGLTDQLAFETSLRQLRELCLLGPSVIHLYQTGFPPAVVGFYRALVIFLMEHPRVLAVVPQYYQGKGRLFMSGTPWRME